MNSLKKAVVVIRHGQKGPNKSDHIQDKNPALPYPPNHPSYFDTAMNTPILGKSVKDLLQYCDLSLTGYQEGTSFATTVPMVMKDFQPISRAIILNPDTNGNTYLTAYPLLAELVANGSLKSLEFYTNAVDIKDKLIPTENDGSILIAGNAHVLNKEKPSILSLLEKHYGKKADELQRGRYIYVYSDPNELQKYTQDPATKTVTPI